MNGGILQISLEALRYLLKLPDEVEFIKVHQSWEQERDGVFEVLVQAPNLQETIPGNLYPWIKCTLEAEFCATDEITHIVKGQVENY